MRGLLILIFIANAVGAQTLSVPILEDVYTLVSPENGSGPLWSYGCTTIARIGEEVYVVQMETGEGVPLLCNTRWRLLQRAGGAWKVFAEADDYRQREPAILAVTGRDTLNLYVNDSLTAPGEEYKTCLPHVLRFNVGSSALKMGAIHPDWGQDTYFTDHSYRSYTSDAASRHLLMMNIDAKTSKEHWALIDQHGVTLANGAISFPIRSCYPQLSVKNGAAHLMAISDIVEPIEEWRTYKFDQTGQKWDYVFRRLYYSTSPDLRAQDFAEPLEIANVEATAGYISNQDLWVAPDGTALLLYRQQECQSALLRDKFFPTASLIPSLHLAIVRDMEVIERKVLVAGTENSQPGWARFHETPDGRLFALITVSGENSGNKLLQVYPALEEAALIDVPLETPFSAFLLADTRAGNAPSNHIDVLGHSTSGNTLTYARIDIE